jgi:hypothetical protein
MPSRCQRLADGANAACPGNDHLGEGTTGIDRDPKCHFARASVVCRPAHKNTARAWSIQKVRGLVN